MRELLLAISGGCFAEFQSALSDAAPTASRNGFLIDRQV
jgi:hypothetical protein